MTSVQNVLADVPQNDTTIKTVTMQKAVPMRATYNNAYMPDTFVKEQNKSEKRAKISTIANVGLAAAFITWAITGLLTHKVNKANMKAQEEYYKKLTENVGKEGGKLSAQFDKLSEKILKKSPGEITKIFNTAIEKGDFELAIASCPIEEYRIAAKNEYLKGHAASTAKIKNILSMANMERFNSNEVDLKAACKLMDEKLIGMDEVKREMLDFLVEYNYCIRNNIKRTKPFVICIDGPAGTGKTTASEVLAEAMGMKYKKISLAGANGKAPIKGFESVYTGASPGGIAQGQLDYESNRVLYCLDEAEKSASSDHNGKVEDCLLSLFDDQAKFVDDYLEVPIDLSQSVFVLTTNEFEKLSDPLKNRVRKITINEYDDTTKAEIAKLKLKNALKHYGLEKKVTVYNDIYNTIAQSTKDGGGRETTQKVDTLIKKIIGIFELNKDRTSLDLNSKFVTESLNNKNDSDILSYFRKLLSNS